MRNDFNMPEMQGGDGRDHGIQKSGGVALHICLRYRPTTEERDLPYTHLGRGIYHIPT